MLDAGSLLRRTGDGVDSHITLRFLRSMVGRHHAGIAYNTAIIHMNPGLLVAVVSDIVLITVCMIE